MIHPSGLFFVSGVVESEMFEMILADPFCFGASFQELVQVSACEEPLRSSVPGPWPPFIKAAALCLFFFILNLCTSAISFDILKVKFYLAIISKS